MKDELKQRIIESMAWMITYLKWQIDIEREHAGWQDMEGGYSEELTEAMDILKELEDDS